jgi:hypothetical protein
MTYPREEQLNMDGMTYVENIQWRLFLDLEGELPGKQVLVLMDDHYTILDAATFKGMAERILKQL